MRLWQATLGQEQAPANRRRFQRALMKDRLEDQVAQFLGQFRVVRGLRLPELSKLLLQVAAVGVEVIARLFLAILAGQVRVDPGADGGNLAGVIRTGAAPVQELAIGARARRHHGMIQPGRGLRDQPALVVALVVALVGAPVRLEPAPLVQPGCPQRIGGEHGQRRSLVGVSRHQPGLGHAFHQHGAGVAPPDGKRLPGLGLAPIAKDPHAAVENPHGPVVDNLVEKPANRGGSDIKSEAGRASDPPVRGCFGMLAATEGRVENECFEGIFQLGRWPTEAGFRRATALLTKCDDSRRG